MAVGLCYALIAGYIASRLRLPHCLDMRLPPLLGYLLAGIAVGPFTPGFVADAKLAPQLAEIGVILFMSGVGMHFSFRDLQAVRSIAIPGALMQIRRLDADRNRRTADRGCHPRVGVVRGIRYGSRPGAFSCEHGGFGARSRGGGLVQSQSGRIAVGWLIVEDAVTVLILVLLPALSGVLGSSGDTAHPVEASHLYQTLGIIFAKFFAFILLMLVVGGRLLHWLLERVAATGSRELFTLAVVVVAIGVGYEAAELFGLSFALGAFFAGVVVGESDHSDRASEEMRPFQDAFTALFFVAVGMLFDPRILLTQSLQVLAVLSIIVLGKAAAAFAIVVLLRQPISSALIVAASLAQIGEFSFILGELGNGAPLAFFRRPDFDSRPCIDINCAQYISPEGSRCFVQAI
jgi:monovalent cation:H+ antiporter-2, CPA2 family